MSSNVEERVVEMRFDNKKFEENAKDTMKTLDKLDKSLDLKGSTEGFERLEKAAKNLDLDAASKAVEAVTNKFSIMGTIGDQVLRNLTNRAADFAVNWTKAMTLDQVNKGWSKYEAKTQAVQVMLHALKDEGVTIDDVNEVLADLNTYTDNTSYHFDQMVDSMSKFTSAGIKMEDAEKMVEGIANWAASSGVSADKAGSAFYNLSQAMSSGALRAQDWKSIELLNMNSKEFEEKAIEIAQAMVDDGRASEEMAAAFKKANPQVQGFRDSLSTGWLDKDVMTELFKVYADQTEEFGYSAYMAAYEAKSLTDAVEAAKESVASGWANIFEQIFGNYEEAKVFWTEVADAMIETFSAPTNALSELLTEWHDTGGYIAFIESIRNAWAAVKGIGEAVAEVFNNIFPAVSANKLVSITQKLEGLTGSWRTFASKIDLTEIMLSAKDLKALEDAGEDLSWYYANLDEARKHNEQVDENLQSFKETVAGLFSVINLVKTVTTALFKIALPFTKLLIPIAKIVGVITSALGRLSSTIVDAIIGSEWFNNVVEKLNGYATKAANYLAGLADRFAEFLNTFTHMPWFEEFVALLEESWEIIKNFASPYVNKAKTALGNFVTEFKQLIKAHAPEAITAIGTALTWFIKIATDFTVKVGSWLVPTLQRLWANLKILWGWLKNIGSNLKALWEEQIVPSKTYQAIKTKIDNLIAKVKGFADKFVDILKNGGIKAAFDWLKEQFDAVVEKIRKWDVGKVLKNALEAGIILKIISAILTLRKITKTLKYIRSFLVGFPKALKGFSKGLMIKRVSASILMLAAALWVLAQIPTERLVSLGNAIAQMAALLVAATVLMALAMKLLNKGEKFQESFAFSKAVSGLITLALSILVLSAALKIISTIPEKQLQKSVIALAEILAAITLATIVMSTSGKTVLSAGVGLLAFVAALLLLSVAFERIKATISELMSASNTSVLVSLGIILGAIVAVMFVLSRIFKGADKETWKLSAIVISFGAAMLLIAFAVERIAKLKGADFLKAAGVLAALIVIVVLLTKATKGVSVDSSKKVFAMAAAILAIGLAVNGIAVALIALSLIPKEMMLKGLLRLIAVTVLMNTMLKAAGKIQPKSAGGILATAVTLAAVVSALWFLQKQDLTKISKSAIVLSGVMLALGIAMRMATKFTNGASTWMSLAAMALIITVVGQSLIGLSKLDFSGKVKKSAIALGGVILAVATAMAIAGKAANKAHSWASLLAMAGIVVAVAGALSVMAQMPVTKMLYSARTLGALMIVLGLVAKSMHKNFSETADLKGTLASIITMFSILAFIVGALFAINAIGMSSNELVITAISLAGLMGALTVCTAAVSKIKGATPKSAVGILSMFGAIILPVVAALALAKRLIPDPSGLVSIAGSIALIVLAMTAPVAACMALGKAMGGMGAIGAAAGGAAGFGLALAILVAVVVGIGYLVDFLGSDNLAGKVESAGRIMESVGNAIGGLIGGLMAGIGNAVFDSIANWGADIKVFCEDVSAGLSAFDGVTINGDAIAAIGDLAEAILLITAAEVVDGIARFIGGGADPTAQFTKDLLVLAPALALFSSLTKNVDAEHATKVAQAIDALGEAATSVGWMEPQWLQSLIGRPKTLAEFADELNKALPNITKFMIAAMPLSAFSDSAKNVTEAIGSLVDVANKLPREGGLWQDIAGEVKGIDEFARELSKSIVGIASFFIMASKIQGDANAATEVSKAIESIIMVAKKLPRTGGTWQSFIGEITPMNEFAAQLANSTDGIEAFAKMSTRIKDNVEDMGPITAAIGALIDVANALNPIHETNWKGWSGYTRDVQSLGDFMKAFGSSTTFSGSLFGKDFSFGTEKTGLTEQISSFAEEMTRLTETGALEGLQNGVKIIEELGRVGSAVTAANTEISVLWGTVEVSTTQRTLLDVLADTLGNLGTAMDKFAVNASASGIGSFAAAEGLHQIIQTMVDYRRLMLELSSDPGAAISLVRGLVDELADTIAYLVSAMHRVDDDLSSAGYDGDLSNITSIFDLFDQLGENGLAAENIASLHEALLQASALQEDVTAGLFITGITDKLTSGANVNKFFNAGAECVRGFADGIRANIRVAEAVADQLSEATIQAMRRALRIQSPSRIMRRIGDYAGEGYYLGLEDWVGSSVRAGEDLSKGVTQAALAALDYIAALMNGDLVVDIGIRPVLDLSNMQSGMNELDAMFSHRQAILAQVDSESLNRNDEVSELVNVSWQILREIQNSRDIYLDGKVLAGSMNRRLGRYVDLMAAPEGGL